MICAEVIDRKDETPSVTTLTFEWNEDVRPGQFVMVWIPGVGEIPMSLSVTDGTKAITVKEYGETSRALRNLRAGDKLLFRGPYGNSFTLVDGDILLVGGGTGMASLKPLIRDGAYAIVSARNERELLFAEEFDDNKVFRVTDDGSAGIKGTPVDQLKKMELDRFRMIYVCGPEMMLKSVLDHLVARNVKAEFSLERNMKCGIGICDSCSIDGLQLCKDGPVFDIPALMRMSEFGVTKLTVSGKRVIV